MKNHFLLFLIAGTCAVLMSCSGDKGLESKGSMLTNGTDSMSYCLGVSISTNLKNGGVDSVNPKMFAQAFEDLMKGDTVIKLQQAQEYLDKYFNKIQQKKNEGIRTESEKFIADNKSKPGVITTSSGLQYIVMKEGTGPLPKETDIVKVHYHGTLTDGKVFDSSVERGEPVTFPVNGVIPGWVEALQLMKVGSKYKVFIPWNLGYGEQGAPPMIKPYAALIFEMELIGIEPPAKADPKKTK